MNGNLRVLIVGCGNMGRAHAKAYHGMGGTEIVGLTSRGEVSRGGLAGELAALADAEGQSGRRYACYGNFEQAMEETKPDIVVVSTYTGSHYGYVKQALEAGCDVFVEKPLAATLSEARELVGLAGRLGRVMMVGYILRVHPGWQEFIRRARGLGQPLVMRMNLNQQSYGEAWRIHRELMESCTPLQDCGVHYVDVMCQMVNGSKPVKVSRMGARLSGEVAGTRQNYGQLQVEFADGSVGWYEAGWGPMMSQTAYFIKDVIGPGGSISMMPAKEANARGVSADVSGHTAAQGLLVHRAERDANGNFAHADEWVPLEDGPDHDGLCRLEQEKFLSWVRDREGVRGEMELHWQAVLDSMEMVGFE